MGTSTEDQDPSDLTDDCQPQHFGYPSAREAVRALTRGDYPVDRDDPRLSEWGW